jgi:hypothetical protein
MPFVVTGLTKMEEVRQDVGAPSTQRNDMVCLVSHSATPLTIDQSFALPA